MWEVDEEMEEIKDEGKNTAKQKATKLTVTTGEIN